jgi:hypothetical protein
MEMKNLKDPLFEIFEKNLYTSIVEDESQDEFIDRVVYEFIHSLVSTGRVPQSHIEDIEEDLREEILDMLRKKTYGHLSLKDYRDSMREQGKMPRKVS